MRTTDPEIVVEKKEESLRKWILVPSASPHTSCVTLNGSSFGRHIFIYETGMSMQVLPTSHGWEDQRPHAVNTGQY